MRIWSPCPKCGASPWRPSHAGRAHDADVADLDGLIEWANSVAS